MEKKLWGKTQYVILIKIHERLEFTYIEWLETDPDTITW